ncbi:MAG: hypothetical protein IT373_05445 [Polyangiaceae bacterium]|nr:hypothetical protein [Polyangiaceae bacterium]
MSRLFFPQAALDVLVAAGSVELDGEELVIVGKGLRYKIVEAVRILREVAGGGDPEELCGRVKSRQYLNELGAELLGESLLLGDSAYDVSAGFVGVPGGEVDATKLTGGTEELELAELVKALG